MHDHTYRVSLTTPFVTPVVEHLLEREIAHWVHHEGSILFLGGGVCVCFVGFVTFFFVCGYVVSFFLDFLFCFVLFRFIVCFFIGGGWGVGVGPLNIKLYSTHLTVTRSQKKNHN